MRFDIYRKYRCMSKKLSSKNLLWLALISLFEPNLAFVIDIGLFDLLVIVSRIMFSKSEISKRFISSKEIRVVD